MTMLDEFDIEFIEYTGLHMQADGLPKIAGRIFGLLILSKEPLSFSVIAETLQVSRGSVSTNTRLLESLGIAERVSIMGERQDYFRLPKNPYSNLMDGVSSRMQNYMESLTDTLEKAPKRCFKRSRLLDHKKFYQTSIKDISDLADKLRCQ